MPQHPQYAHPPYDHSSNCCPPPPPLNQGPMPSQYPPNPAYTGQYYPPPSYAAQAPSPAPNYPPYLPPLQASSAPGPPSQPSFRVATALNPQYIAQRQTHVRIDPKRGEVDVGGRPALKVKEHNFFSSKTGESPIPSLLQYTKLTLDFQTSTHQPLFTIREHALSSHAFEIDSPAGISLLKVKTHTFSSDTTASFRNAVPPYEEVTLEARSGMQSWDVVRWGLGPVMSVKVGSVYEVVVEAGCDVALAAALAYIGYKRSKNTSTAIDIGSNIGSAVGGAGA